MQVIRRLPEPTAGGRTTPHLIRRIIVPLDGTPYAEQALAPATAMARALSAEVLLVRAHPTAAMTAHLDARTVKRRERGPLLNASLYLARKEQELRARRIRVGSDMPFGQAGEAIAATAAAQVGSLVVMATHMGSLFSHPSQVSVARELLRRAEVPVLLLSSAVRNPFERLGGVGLTLLVPLEESAREPETIPYAATLAQALAGHVLLLRAVGVADGVGGGDGKPLSSARTNSTRNQLTFSLDLLRDELLGEGIPTWSGIVEGDLIEQTIYQARVGGEMILLGLSWRDEATREAAIQSAFDLLRVASVPILVVPRRTGPEPIPSQESNARGTDVVASEE